MSLPGIDPVISATVRAALSMLFASAAVHKLRDLAQFRSTLAHYALLPPPWVASATLCVVASECLIALLLWRPSPVGPLSAAGLLAVYAGAIAINLHRGRRDIDCGCSGPTRRQPVSAALVVRNVILITFALAGAVPATTRALLWLDGLTIFIAASTLALLYTAVEGLLANRPRLAALRHRHEATHA